MSTIQSGQQNNYALERASTFLDPVETTSMRYLPSIFHNDMLMQRLLAIYEAPFVDFMCFLETLSYYFDPRMTPSSFLPFLAQWVAMRLNGRWPVERQREVIMRAVELYRWRGTAEGIKLFLELLTGHDCEISQTFNGFRLGMDYSRMGRETLMASGPDRTFIITIHAQVTAEEEILIRQVIEAEKPAHAAYELCLEAGLDLSALPSLGF
jgi:phage tail-like protein